MPFGRRKQPQKKFLKENLKWALTKTSKFYTLAHSQNIKKYWSNKPEKKILLCKVTLLVIWSLHKKIDLLVKKWTLLSNLPKSEIHILLQWKLKIVFSQKRLPPQFGALPFWNRQIMYFMGTYAIFNGIFSFPDFFSQVNLTSIPWCFGYALGYKILNLLWALILNFFSKISLEVVFYYQKACVCQVIAF